MYSVQIANNLLIMKFTDYTNEVRTVDFQRQFDNPEELKSHVFGCTITLMDNHFYQFIELLKKNRDHIYKLCEQRTKLSLEDYDFTQTMYNVSVVKEAYDDPASSIYRRAKMIYVNQDFLFSVTQKMKVKGFEARQLLADLFKEARLILRQINL